MATPALYHEYLYDSANLGFDGATASNFSSFREHLEASFIGAAAGSPDPVTLGFSGAEAGAAAARTPASVAHAAAPPPAVQEPYRVDAYGVQAASTGRALLATGGGASAGTAAGGPPAPGNALSPRAGTAGAPSPGATLAAGFAHEGRAAAAPSVGLVSGEGVVAPRTESGLPEDASAGARAATVFAPACQLHEMIDGPQFTFSHIGGVRFVDLLAGWFAGEPTPTVIDAHAGPRSPGECGKDPAAAAASAPPLGKSPTSNPSSGLGSGAFLPAPAPAHDAAESRDLGPPTAAQAGGVSNPGGGSGTVQAALVVPFRIEGIAF